MHGHACHSPKQTNRVRASWAEWLELPEGKGHGPLVGVNLLEGEPAAPTTAERVEPELGMVGHGEDDEVVPLFDLMPIPPPEAQKRKRGRLLKILREFLLADAPPLQEAKFVAHLGFAPGAEDILAPAEDPFPMVPCGSDVKMCPSTRSGYAAVSPILGCLDQVKKYVASSSHANDSDVDKLAQNLLQASQFHLTSQVAQKQLLQLSGRALSSKIYRLASSISLHVKIQLLLFIHNVVTHLLPTQLTMC